MRAAFRALPPLLLFALGLAACGGEAPTSATSASSSPMADPAAPAAPPAPTAPLDTAALRQRAAEALGANRLYAPAGDNAVEDYLALRDREPSDDTVATALADLAPYVIIGAEQAIAADAFPEAGRLIALLARMEADAPAVPRLREALAAAEAEAAARIAAAQADAERLAAEARAREAERPRTDARASPTPSPATAAASSAACRRASPRPPNAAASRARWK